MSQGIAAEAPHADKEPGMKLKQSSQVIAPAVDDERQQETQDRCTYRRRSLSQWIINY